MYPHIREIVRLHECVTLLRATHVVVIVQYLCLSGCLSRNCAAWYKSRSYRARSVREPREVLKEFGLEIPPSVSIRVHDSTADLRYIVIPQRPAGELFNFVYSERI